MAQKGRHGGRAIDASVARYISLADTFAGTDLRIGQLKRAVQGNRKYLGISEGAMILLDQLFAYTREQDWQDGIPIVWASNTKLMADLGLADDQLRTLQRRLAELINKGLVVRRESGNGVRRGLRSAEGRIVYAYGFDLSPIAVRHNELMEAKEREVAEQKLRQMYRKEATAIRRELRLIAEGAAKDVQKTAKLLYDEALILTEKAKRATTIAMEGILESLRELRGNAVEISVKEIGITAPEPEGMTPWNDKPVMPTTPTKTDQYDSSCNRLFETERRRTNGTQTCSVEEVEMDLRLSKLEANSIFSILRTTEAYRLQKTEHGLFGTAFRSEKVTWGQITIFVAEGLRSYGLADHVIEDLIVGLGDRGFSVSGTIAMFRAESVDNERRVTNVGGYLRGMLRKASYGGLKLSRSAYAILRSEELKSKRLAHVG